MKLTEETQVADAELPVADLKRHLRMGSGFAEDDLQNEVLVSFLRAAIAAVEARTRKAILARGFAFEFGQDPSGESVVLPVAPVTELVEVARLDAAGTAEIIALADYALEDDAHMPKVTKLNGTWPQIARAGRLRLRFVAGYGAVWGDVPADLAHAVIMLAAHYYEYRTETRLDDGNLPFGVAALLSRYRVMRLGGRA